MKFITPPKSITLAKENADTTIFLIHGYTGSPHDFNGLPQLLHKNCAARVHIMLLPGHGTSVHHLDNISYKSFVTSIEEEFAQEFKTGRNIIVGGISFGALMALHLATHYPVEGVINIGAPFSLKLPFALPGIELMRFYKKHWQKRFSAPELSLRQGQFYYSTMHINGLSLVKQTSRELKRHLASLTCPIITLHSSSDPIGSVRGVRRLARYVSSPHEVIVYNNKNHNIFYGESREEAYKDIEAFVERVMRPADVSAQHKVAAIVPAYNEAKTILPVLKVLIHTPDIDEVIVIDDGSTDNTARIAQSVPGVQVLINNHNYGKSCSLGRGINHTKADVLFFCDADLKGLSSPIVSAIIKPVIAREQDMFIGVRNNVSQKIMTLFALNSGERALRRELWHAVPTSFKHRYRLEVGLNITAHRRKNGYGWRRFEYYQTLKEVKYGFIRGTILRWWMNTDVLYAYVLALFTLLTQPKQSS